MCQTWRSFKPFQFIKVTWIRSSDQREGPIWPDKSIIYTCNYVFKSYKIFPTSIYIRYRLITWLWCQWSPGLLPVPKLWNSRPLDKGFRPSGGASVIIQWNVFNFRKLCIFLRLTKLKDYCVVHRAFYLICEIHVS